MRLIAKMTQERQELSYHAERGNYKKILIQVLVLHHTCIDGYDFKPLLDAYWDVGK